MDKPISEGVRAWLDEWCEDHGVELPADAYNEMLESLTAAQQQWQAVAEVVQEADGVNLRFVGPILPAGTKLYTTAPPSAPVGVDKEAERRLIDVAASMLNDNNGKIGKRHFKADATAVVRRVLRVLAAAQKGGA